MDVLERVLVERSDALIQALTHGAGFSPEQAARFLEHAAPALVDSRRWQTLEDPEGRQVRRDDARELLAGVSGHSLAPRVGLTVERSWAGLRTLAWAATAECEAVSAPNAPSARNTRAPVAVNGRRAPSPG